MAQGNQAVAWDGMNLKAARILQHFFLVFN
jgi:hypothetical protein